MAVSKLVLIGSGVGASIATAGGVALYLTSGETIREHITKVSSSNRKFIDLVPEAEASLKAKYLKLGQNKPNKDNKAVEDIVKWCKDSENIKFSSDKDADYLSMNAWCFVNINSLEQEAKFKGKFYISDKGKNDEEWKTAWTTYNTQKTNAKLEISDANLKGANAKEQGGPLLYDWCKGQDNKKMYEENSEDTYKRYEKWCFKPQ